MLRIDRQELHRLHAHHECLPSSYHVCSNKPKRVTASLVTRIFLSTLVSAFFWKRELVLGRRHHARV